MGLAGGKIVTACTTCAERRRKLLEAWQNRQIAEAVRQAALVAAEMVGVKRKGDEDGKE